MQLSLHSITTAQHLLIDAAESPPGYPPILSAEVAVNEDGLSPPGPSPVAGGSCTGHASPSCPGTVGSPESATSAPCHHATASLPGHHPLLSAQCAADEHESSDLVASNPPSPKLSAEAPPGLPEVSDSDDGDSFTPTQVLTELQLLLKFCLNHVYFLSLVQWCVLIFFPCYYFSNQAR